MHELDESPASSEIRVLIIDDSPTLRAIISACLHGVDGIVVVGEAGDPYEAREAIKRFSPDVITLDIEMPRMHGLDFLERLMRLRPTPVIMISTLTTKAADAAIQALQLGAFDCVAKPQDGDFRRAFAHLPELVRAAAASNRHSVSEPPKTRPAPQTKYRPNKRIVAIGSSTGGLEAISTICTEYPENCPPTVIVQHIPGSFSQKFAERLNQHTSAYVCEAFDGAPVEPGRIYIAPGGDYHLELVDGVKVKCRLIPGGRVSGHRPSVDVLFNSVASLGERAVGVLLTGMGKDGAEGLLKVRRAGGTTLGQDESTSVVYGMPRVAFEMGAVEMQRPIGAMADEILRLCASAGGVSHAS